MGQVSASSAPVVATESEAPVVESAPASESSPSSDSARESFIPRARFDEVHGKWRAAEERAAQREELIAQLLQGQEAGTQPAAVPEPNPDREMLRSIRNEVLSLRDERDREAFWRENAEFGAPLQKDVEDMLGAFRDEGVRNIRRNDLLAYKLGEKSLSELKAKAAKAKAEAPSPARVAYAEAGPTARPAPVKRLEEMSAEDADGLTLEQLTEALRGRTF